MAKKQTFSDKTNKKNDKSSLIKLVRTGYSNKTGALKFLEEMVHIPEGNTPDAYVKDLLSKK